MAVDRYDWLATVGLVLLAVGLVWVWWPLALIVPGVALLAIGVIGAMGRGPSPRSTSRRGT